MSDEEKSKKDNIFFDLLINILIPALTLSKFSKDNYLGPFYGLIIALAFPLLYGLYDFIFKKKKNFISILGFMSIFLTGTIGLLKLPAHLIAFKEALVPFLIGLFVLISIKTPFPLLKKMIYNKEILSVEKIENILLKNGNKKHFEKTMTVSSILLSLTFFISSILNFILAKILIKSESGTTSFNEELGKMTLLSYPVIALPSMIMLLFIVWFIIKSIKKYTDLTSEDIFSEKLQSKPKTN
jgi:hypothetical protein